MLGDRLSSFGKIAVLDSAKFRKQGSAHILELGVAAGEGEAAGGGLAWPCLRPLRLPFRGAGTGAAATSPRAISLMGKWRRCETGSGA